MNKKVKKPSQDRLIRPHHKEKRNTKAWGIKGRSKLFLRMGGTARVKNLDFKARCPDGLLEQPHQEDRQDEHGPSHQELRRTGNSAYDTKSRGSSPSDGSHI